MKKAQLSDSGEGIRAQDHLWVPGVGVESLGSTVSTRRSLLGHPGYLEVFGDRDLWKS